MIAGESHSITHARHTMKDSLTELRVGEVNSSATWSHPDLLKEVQKPEIPNIKVHKLL